MAWKMIGTPVVRKGTRALAQQFAGMTPVPHERAMKSENLKRLRAEIEGGKFRTCEWASAICDGVEYRVNGKHTATLLAEYAGDYEYYVTIERFTCDTFEDLARLYATFDPRSSARSTRDINRIYAASDADLAPLPTRLIDGCVTGIAFAEWEDAYSLHRPEERAENILRHKDFVLWLHRIAADDHDGMLRRGPVVAAIFKTYHRSRNEAERFWTDVRDGLGEPDCPQRAANKMLLKTSLGSSRSTGSGKTIVGYREMYVRLLQAWNAHRRGGKTDLRYYANAKTPDVA